MHWLLQLAWSARRLLIGLLRLRTEGVKVMLFNPAGEVLLVRNNYGNRKLFVLPGGGVARGEMSLEAAKRELKEEVGVSGAELRFVARFESRSEGKRDTISLFTGTSAEPLRPDPVEIAEAGFFPLSALPAETSAATLRRIAEKESGKAPDATW